MVEPTSLKEALSLLDPQEPTIRPVAGGTALMLMMKAGVFQPTRLVCLHKIEPEHARIAISSPKQKLEMPLEELYSGYYETVLEKNELITAVTVPALGGRKAAYVKVTSRTADDWPALGVAVSVALKDGAMRDPIVVVSAATEKVTR